MRSQEQYEIALTQAESYSTEVVERWKADHQAANLAADMNGVYLKTNRLYRFLIRLDAATPDDLRQNSKARKLALEMALSLYRKLAKVLKRVRPEDYGYEATEAKARTMATGVRLMISGKKVWDPEESKRAKEALAKGEVLTLDEFAQRLERDLRAKHCGPLPPCVDS